MICDDFLLECMTQWLTRISIRMLHILLVIVNLHMLHIVKLVLSGSGECVKSVSLPILKIFNSCCRQLSYPGIHNRADVIEDYIIK